jgi:hypothetical protein
VWGELVAMVLIRHAYHILQLGCRARDYSDFAQDPFHGAGSSSPSGDGMGWDGMGEVNTSEIESWVVAR